MLIIFGKFQHSHKYWTMTIRSICIFSKLHQGSNQSLDVWFAILRYYLKVEEVRWWHCSSCEEIPCNPVIIIVILFKMWGGNDSHEDYKETFSTVSYQIINNQMRFFWILFFLGLCIGYLVEVWMYPRPPKFDLSSARILVPIYSELKVTSSS
jgi:hypothetical protein